MTTDTNLLITLLTALIVAWTAYEQKSKIIPVVQKIDNKTDILAALPPNILVVDNKK